MHNISSSDGLSSCRAIMVFKQQLKLHDLLITDKHQPYVKSVYSLGGATLTKGAAYKYLLIPVNKLKEFCKFMGAEISDNAKDTKKEDIA